MQINFYSIFDSAAKAFTQPFQMHNDTLAKRAFADNVNSTDENNISKHPEQFSLYHIGIFDDQTGIIDALYEPLYLCSAKSLQLPTAPDEVITELDKLKTELHNLKTILNEMEITQ